MTEPLVITAGEMETNEIIEAINEGRRVVVQTEFLGSKHEVTLRHDGQMYYCDTPARLHKHSSEQEMRECLREQGYASSQE